MRRSPDALAAHLQEPEDISPVNRLSTWLVDSVLIRLLANGQYVFEQPGGWDHEPRTSITPGPISLSNYSLGKENRLTFPRIRVEPHHQYAFTSRSWKVGETKVRLSQDRYVVEYLSDDGKIRQDQVDREFVLEHYKMIDGEEQLVLVKFPNPSQALVA